MANELEFPKVNGDILFATDVNLLNDNNWSKIIFDAGVNEGLIKFSADVWQSDGQRTTNAGSSWASPGFDNNWIATTDLNSTVSGLSSNPANANTKYTIDAGATWTSSSTQPSAGNMTVVRDLTQWNDAVIVVGDAGGNESIYVSADGGNTFAEATTGPTGTVDGVALASATVGYLIQNGTNQIWKTTNAGVDWTDTTDTSIANTQSIIADTVDTIHYVNTTRPEFYKYTNSTNTIVTLFSISMEGKTSNIVKATNGNFYFGFWIYSAAGTSATLHLFKWDGNNAYMKPLGFPTTTNFSGLWDKSPASTPVLIEVSNKLYLNMGTDNIMEIDLRGD